MLTPDKIRRCDVYAWALAVAIIEAMARKSRIEFSGACFHVINRGNYRRDLFADEGAAESFEKTLFEACSRFSWRLHAFVIMRNHFHLAVELSDANLSLGMKWLQGAWAIRFNRYHHQVGRPFQGRYKGIHVEPGNCLAQVGHYIHLNPLRAGAVLPETLDQFRHSSLWHFRRRSRPYFLEPSTILRESGGLDDTPQGWLLYLRYLLLLAETDPDKRKEAYEPLSSGWCLGTKDYRGQLERHLICQGHPPETAPTSVTSADWNEVRQNEWERKLQRAAAATGADLGSLPPKKSAFAKVRLAALVKASTSASNVWLAHRLAMGKPDSVSQFIRRFQLRGDHLSDSFVRALSEVRT